MQDISSSLFEFGKTASSKKYSDPFILPSNSYIPRSLDSALDLCLYLFHLNPKFRQTTIRTVAHFVTSLSFDSRHGDSREREEHADLLEKSLAIYDLIMQAGMECMCYGNSFVRIHWPFYRYLVDSRGGKSAEYALSAFPEDLVTFNLQEMTYTIPDPRDKDKSLSSRARVSLPFRDRVCMTPNKIKLRTLDPRHVRTQHKYLSGETRYIYQFESWFKKEIEEGLLYQVNSTPIDMLKALQKDQDFMFGDGQLFHFKAPTMAGVSHRGWGVPEVLLNYSNLHQLQVYRKIDEQIGREHMMPIRIFSPEFGTDPTSATVTGHLGMWANNVAQIIKSHRKDPTLMHSSPLPLKYNEYGAAGKSLVPKDLIEYQTQAMLDGAGYPEELYRATLQMQQMPTALRLFESAFRFIPDRNSRLVQWISDQILGFLGRPKLPVSMEKPSMADDIEQRHVWLQLAGGGEVSRRRAYQQFGIDDAVAEFRDRLDEDMEMERVKAKAQADFEREQTVGSMDKMLATPDQSAPAPAPAAGGMGPSAVIPTNVTPTDVMQIAEEEAIQLLQMDEGSRRKRMQALQATNPNLHAATKQKMEEIRSQGASAGRQQAAQMVTG